MKIYILPINEKFRPKDQSWKYPKHNKKFGVEQDFFEFLKQNSEFTTDNPESADWHYLPVFWTRWHVGHNFAENQEGLPELQTEADSKILDDEKTFTICQYDDGPVINIGKTKLFLSSRKTDVGFDIPLLSANYNPWFLFKPKKKYLASFLGKTNTHEIRPAMVDALKNRQDIFLFSGHKSPRFFTKKILESYCALSPRGYGGSSFRFFEAMRLGVVPFLIGNLDTRPFKEFISYGEISFYTNDPKEILPLLDSMDKEKLTAMGLKSRDIFQKHLAYQKWCPYVIRTLEKIS